ncbi:pentatricopeptide repeat-containing protein chloroplastic [Dorcoceras hygrometricum]|uniref:Pentatricopeptide repeat-containing protein chloroplastic n=1 Tax=Dorcoceras hygrometricum TaxID=472368 RepID=A0A2Z7AE73_9LAMI|nr:pentatricopeptide repeat-containing protein chloroplastic [Dorcoceras hygrometricum]
MKKMVNFFLRFWPPKPHPPAVVTARGTPAFPCLTASNFSDRRSARFVSKLHFGRPRSTSSSCHSSTAEEALHYAINGCGRVECMDEILLGFRPKLCASDDYTFLLRGLGNREEWSKAMRCFQFAISFEKRRNELGKLTTSMISTLGRLGKVDL